MRKESPLFHWNAWDGRNDGIKFFRVGDLAVMDPVDGAFDCPRGNLNFYRIGLCAHGCHVDLASQSTDSRSSEIGAEARFRGRGLGEKSAESCRGISEKDGFTRIPQGHWDIGLAINILGFGFGELLLCHFHAEMAGKVDANQNRDRPKQGGNYLSASDRS